MQLIVDAWSKFVDAAPRDGPGTVLGYRVRDEQTTVVTYGIAERRRAEHVVILGKTGTGKTSLIKAMLSDDVRKGRGFICIDLHGDLAPFILGRIRQHEQQMGHDL